MRHATATAQGMGTPRNRRRPRALTVRHFTASDRHQYRQSHNRNLCPGSRVRYNDPFGAVYVTTPATSVGPVVTRVSPSGEWAIVLDSLGDGAHPLLQPGAIDTDAEGDVFVTDRASNSVFVVPASLLQVPPPTPVIEILSGSCSRTTYDGKMIGKQEVRVRLTAAVGAAPGLTTYGISTYGCSSSCAAPSACTVCDNWTRQDTCGNLRGVPDPTEATCTLTQYTVSPLPSGWNQFRVGIYPDGSVAANGSFVCP